MHWGRKRQHVTESSLQRSTSVGGSVISPPFKPTLEQLAEQERRRPGHAICCPEALLPSGQLMASSDHLLELTICWALAWRCEPTVILVPLQTPEVGDWMQWHREGQVNGPKVIRHLEVTFGTR